MIYRLSVSIIEFPHRWAIAAFACCLAFIALVDVRPAVRSWGDAPAEIRGAVERVPAQIVSQMLPVVDKHAGLIRRDLFGAVEKLQVRVLDPKTGQFTALRKAVLRRADAGLDIIRDVRAKDLGPVLMAARGTLTDGGVLVKNANDSWNDLYPDVKTTVASSTVAVTSFAHASMAVRDAAPQITLNVQRATDESALTAQQTRLFMGNLVKASKPLPLPVRIGLAVAPPLVQTGFTIGSWMALKGK